jgi:hypothetical protein
VDEAAGANPAAEAKPAQVGVAVSLAPLAVEAGETREFEVTFLPTPRPPREARIAVELWSPWLMPAEGEAKPRGETVIGPDGPVEPARLRARVSPSAPSVIEAVAQIYADGKLAGRKPFHVEVASRGS